MANRSNRHAGNLVSGEVFEDRSVAEAGVCGIHQGPGAKRSQREAGIYASNRPTSSREAPTLAVRGWTIYATNGRFALATNRDLASVSRTMRYGAGSPPRSALTDGQRFCSRSAALEPAVRRHLGSGANDEFPNPESARLCGRRRGADPGYEDGPTLSYDPAAPHPACP